MKFITLTNTIIYRRWTIEYINKDKTWTFRSGVYWFTDRKGIKGFNHIRGSTRAYKPKNKIKLLLLSDKNNIKQLLSDANLKHQKIIKELTGYGLVKLNNELCGYNKKPKYELRWCSFPGKGKKPYEGIDGIIALYLAKKYRCDGYIIRGLKSTIKGMIKDYQTEYVIINPKNKLKVLYNDRQSPNIHKNIIMRIQTLNIKPKHWSTDWIPISYTKILSNNQLKKSLTFLWSRNKEVLAICRAYYINKNRIEIGDVWLNNKCRGKFTNKGEKISVVFMTKVINKIWKNYPKTKLISLIVSKNNIPAIKLYKRLSFKINKKVNAKKLGVKNGVFMIKYRHDKIK